MGTEGTGGSTTVHSDFDSDAWLEWTMWCSMNGYDDIGNGYRDSSGKMYTVEEVADLYYQATGKTAVFTSVTLVETPGTEGSEVIDETGSVPSEGNSEPVEGIVGAGNETGSEDEGAVESMPDDTGSEVGVETNSWTLCFRPNWINSLSALCVGLICWAMLYQVLMRNWEAQNLVNNTTDINQFQNDQHIAFPDEIQQKFDWFPDIGAHSGVQVSSLISHMMLSNKGLNNIRMAERYPDDVMDENGDVEFHKGELKETEDGDYIYNSVPMIDDKLGKAFFDSAKIPEKLRVFYEAKKIPYNPGNENREKLKGYDTVADLINKEWEFPEYEPQRPAGAYMVDTAPVNTIKGYMA
ncbi:MAG: hypothetical protein HDQ88_02940 [Clostridia bacterium]|nr:hypothetical protein [Clostridia bacterium]